jgi:hypothetical protein
MGVLLLSITLFADILVHVNGIISTASQVTARREKSVPITYDPSNSTTSVLLKAIDYQITNKFDH